MSGSFIDSEIDSIVEKFSDEPVIKVLKLLDWSRINKCRKTSCSILPSFDDKDIFTSIDAWLFGCCNGKAAEL